LLFETIADFTELITHTKLDSNEVSRTLALCAFKELDPRMVLLAELNAEGCVEFSGWFGISDIDQKSWKKIPITIKLPVTEAILENKFVWITSKNRDWLQEYPDMKHYEDMPMDWATIIVLPVYRNLLVDGAILLFSHSELKSSAELESYLRVIRHIVSYARHPRGDELSAQPVIHELDSSTEGLTLRQLAICQLIAEGYKNKEIASNVGYSESTIKQETIRIFKNLGVKNREQASLLFSNRIIPQSI